MAAVLRLENFAADTTIDLTSSGNIQVLARTETREFSYGTQDELITRTYTLAVTGTTKGTARDSLNSLIAFLRKAKRWHNEEWQRESIFLREAADGETAVRMLVVNYKAMAKTPIVGLDPLQTRHKSIVFDLALTLQNLKEEHGAINLTINSSVEPGAVGIKHIFNRSGASPSALSRIMTKFTAGATAPTNKIWIGMKPSPGTSFRHIWEIVNGTTGTDTTPGAPAADVYSANPVTCTFATATAMTDRYTLRADDQYDADGLTTQADHDQAAGRFMVLLRYRVNGTGNILARLGVTGDLSGPAYTEPVLLTADDEFHFMPMGLISLPPNGLRQNLYASASGIVGGTLIKIAAQRLSGTATLTLDCLTWIPYDHYLSADVDFGVTRSLYTKTYEDLKTRVFMTSAAGVFDSFGRITEINNFMYPIESQSPNGRVVLVAAADHVVAQLHDEDLFIAEQFIYPGHEAYSQWFGR